MVHTPCAWQNGDTHLYRNIWLNAAAAAAVAAVVLIVRILDHFRYEMCVLHIV